MGGDAAGEARDIYTTRERGGGGTVAVEGGAHGGEVEGR